MMFGRTTYNHSPSDLKHYCMARNNLLNLREYRGWPHALAFVAKTVWFYTFTRPSLGRLRLSVAGDARRAARRLHRPPRGSSTSSSRDRRGRHRHLQPRRPARPDARRAGRARPGSRTRSSSSTTPAPTTPARCSRPAQPATCRCSVIHSRRQPRRRRRLPPRRAAGVRRGLRPDLADGRRRGPGARLPRRCCWPRTRPA